MASEKITAIIESVKGLTVLELKELIDTYCEEFGVSAVAAAGAQPKRHPRLSARVPFVSRIRIQERTFRRDQIT